jgi:hypothetical protein
MSESIARFKRSDNQSRNLNWKIISMKEWKCSEIPDFLSDDFVLPNVLNDISNFETGQISVQNNSQTGCYKYSNFKYI